jgi:hypothetical protein
VSGRLDAGLEARRASGRLWAAIMLARTVETCESILAGRRVLARNLDGVVLRRALRGGPLPPVEAWLRVDAAMLDAVVEAGPLELARPARPGQRR